VANVIALPSHYSPKIKKSIKFLDFIIPSTIKQKSPEKALRTLIM